MSDRLERALTQAFVAGQMDAQATELEKWKVGGGGHMRAMARNAYQLAQVTADEPSPWRFCPWCGESTALHMGDPEMNCGTAKVTA